MKPVKLVISGWGPYKDREEIDFSAFSERGVFLITGQTGAGKTTIFDAITYALYGDMSGEVREKNSVRSDFAAPETKTFVELVMEHDGKTYRIARNPEYQRPSKKKGGRAFAVEKENASLTLPEGSVVAGNREVNEKIRDILRLDYRQFKQISMIAQGEFARLLTAPTAEKTRIFREIFDTGRYDQFTQRLKERADRMEKKLMEYRNRMDEDIRLFETKDERFLALAVPGAYPYRELSELLFVLKKEREENAARTALRLAECEKRLDMLRERLNAVRHVNQQFKQKEEQDRRLLALLEREPEMKRLEEKERCAQAADSIRRHYAVFKEAAGQLARERKRCAAAESELEELVKKRALYSPLADREEELADYFQTLERLGEARRKERQLGAELEEWQAELEKRQAAYLSVETKALVKKESYEAAQQLVRRAMIGIVAGLVREGCPCPVCGSPAHPKIARTVTDAPSEKELDKLREEADLAAQKQMSLHSMAQTAKNGLEAVASARESAAEDAKRLNALALQQRGRLSDVLALLTGGPLSGMPSPEDEKNSSLRDKASGGTAQEKESAAAAELDKRFRAVIRENSLLDARIGERREALDLTHSSCDLLKERCRKLEEEYRTAREKQGFSDDDEWRGCLLSEEEKKSLALSLSAYRNELSGCREVLRHLEEALSGRHAEEEAPLNSALEETAGLRDRLSAENREALLSLETAKRTCRSLEENLRLSGGAQEEYGVVKELAELAAGNNEKRLVFEQFVLAGYFEEILRAANIRLSRMSGGRYELFRAQRVGDGRKKDNLEIEVMDYYTGRRRSVRTLSGGESFKASLSLALGMSDIIQAASGGIRVEALFIDEGFGALDTESLEQACDTLEQLAGQDKLIGVISHVAQLKERFEAQLVVTKGRTGSSVQARL